MLVFEETHWGDAQDPPGRFPCRLVRPEHRAAGPRGGYALCDARGGLQGAPSSAASVSIPPWGSWEKQLGPPGPL